jgi:hypothetical protein
MWLLLFMFCIREDRKAGGKMHKNDLHKNLNSVK